MIYRRLFSLFVVSLVFFSFYSPFFISIKEAAAQLSQARCDITASVNQSTRRVTIRGTVKEMRPGIEDSNVFISLYDTSGGFEVNEWVVADSVTREYTKTLDPGYYEAYVDGQTFSNPNGGTSYCSKGTYFTINSPTFRLDVYKSGTGAGTVTGSGISCGSDCSHNYSSGTNVTLTADDAPGSNFIGWSGACSGSNTQCTVSMTQARNVTATFNSNPAPGNFIIGSGSCFGWPSPKIENNLNASSGATSYSLYRRQVGGGWQTIASRWSLQDIDRYGDPVNQNTGYEYFAEAHNSAGTTRSGNTPYYYSGPSQCGQVLYNLSVGVSPSGSGTVTGTVSQATGSGISCGSDCAESYDQRDPWITLQANDLNGYTFSSWSGACTGQATRNCSLQMNQHRSATANFTQNTHMLSVSVNGPGSVTSSPAGINCPSQCNYNFSPQNVELRPTIPNGSSFAGWSGACNGIYEPCVVSMTQARSVTATFSAITPTLSVSISPSGGGTVTGTGINCPTDCSESYTYGTGVNLIPNKATNYDFVNWSGDCTGLSCSLTMTSNKNVTANFTPTAFNYSLSNSGTTSVTKGSGNVYEVNIITKNLIAGATQSVSLSLTGVPSGTSYSISNSTCSPTCSSTITFTVGPTTPVGTHNITVTGSPLSKTTNFSLVITGSPFTVSCSASASKILLGQNVTFSSTVVGGVAPLTYTWSGIAIPTSPAPSTANYTRAYSTIGMKSAAVTVRDGDGVQSTCPAATVEVYFDPNFEEF